MMKVEARAYHGTGPEFITLDGVIQAPGGANEDTDGGFAYGGWTLPHWHDDIGADFFEAFSWADALLLGRNMWRIHGSAFEPMAATCSCARSSRTTWSNTNLHVYPLVLGGGKRLFPHGKRLNLKLTHSTALPTGVLFQQYESPPAWTRRVSAPSRVTGPAPGLKYGILVDERSGRRSPPASESRPP